MIPDDLSYRLSDDIFTTFPSSLINAEAKRLSTPNTLFIVFVIYFSEYCNVDYVSIGTSLSTIMINMTCCGHR